MHKYTFTFNIETLKHLFPHETIITKYIFPNANGVVPL